MDQGTDEIRRSIGERRASIDARLQLLEEKARRLHPRHYLGWIALGSVVAAGSIAVGGIVRSRRRHEPLADDGVAGAMASGVDAADAALATEEALAHDDTLDDLDDDEYEIVFEDSRGHGTLALLASAAAGAAASWVLLRAMARGEMGVMAPAPPGPA